MMWEQFYKAMQLWIDDAGLVADTRNDQGVPDHSGNGVLGAAVMSIYLNELGAKTIIPSGAVMAVLSMDGTLVRHPKAHEDNQEQWDNLVGIACIAAIENNYLVIGSIKELIWRTIKNFGFMDTNHRFEWKDFMFRFPHVWMLLIAPVYPKSRPALTIPLFIASCFMSGKTSGGNQTDMVFKYTMITMGMPAAGIDDTIYQYTSRSVFEYYKQNHPFKSFSYAFHSAYVENKSIKEAL